MAKKSADSEQLVSLEKERDAYKTSSEIARKALFGIIDTSPLQFPVVPGGQPTIVRANKAMQARAEEAVLAMSDAEAVIE